MSKLTEKVSGLIGGFRALDTKLKILIVIGVVVLLAIYSQYNSVPG